MADRMVLMVVSSDVDKTIIGSYSEWLTNGKSQVQPTEMRR